MGFDALSQYFGQLSCVFDREQTALKCLKALDNGVIFNSSAGHFNQSLLHDADFVPECLNLAILHDLYLRDSSRALELYDLRTDPFELRNRINDPTVPKAKLEALLTTIPGPPQTPSPR